jgi:hypothetical protein
MKKRFKEFIRRWRADTPRRARMIRNAAISLSTLVPSAWGGACALPGITLPTWVGYVVFGFTFLALLVGGVAGTREIKPQGYADDK